MDGAGDRARAGPRGRARRARARDRRPLGRRQVDARRARSRRAPVVSLEDLYGGWDGLGRASTAWCATVLEPLARRADRARAPLRLARAALGASRGRCEPPPLLIVEGVGAGALAAAPYTSVLVWLELSASERRAPRARARRRDLRRRHWAPVGAPGGRVRGERPPARAGRPHGAELVDPVLRDVEAPHEADAVALERVLDEVADRGRAVARGRSSASAGRR